MSQEIIVYNLLRGLLLFISCQQICAMDVPSWDLLIFTQSYPVTICQEWKEKDSSHTCSMPLRENGWTIHGIWPTRRGTEGPTFCNRSWVFDIDQVRTINNTLNEYWRNIEKGTPFDSLWAHEWYKHGTCAAVLQPLNNQLKYFKQGINWAYDYSVSNMLASSGIVPAVHKKYALSDIRNAIKRATGVEPMIECHKKNGVNYISEVRICFDKNLHLADCDGILDYYFTDENIIVTEHEVITNCDKTEGVTYLPQLPPNLWYVQFYKLVNWLMWFTL